MHRIVVIGSSVAGIRAAETLRQADPTCDVTVVSDENETPYDRPPLSKKFLAGELPEENIALRKQDVLDSIGASWVRGQAATVLDTSTRTVTLADGSTLTWDGVIIATGGRARHIPTVPQVPGVHVLRTMADARGLKNELQTARNLVVIGAGFIGLEAAATARQMGVEVTVLEGAPAPLVRGLGADMGAAVAQVHARNGVTVRCGVSIEGIDITDGGHVSAVRLAGGESVPADVVLVGIGVTPATDWLENSGLQLRDGVVCDAHLNAGAPGVYAAGDVLRWPNEMFSHVEPDMRVEHWTNAAEQGAVAARNVIAELNGTERETYSAVPFFWSDQFDARIQFLGRSHPDAEVTVVAGSVEEGRWCAMYVLHGRLLAVMGVTMPKFVMSSRALLMKETSREEALAHFENLRNAPVPPPRPAPPGN